ncbi:hypothetical protein XFEB_02371 [Xylella fastidiosa EB92.1]|nr:hypothetical protein XFEB_02371 [Xylella fastidiosa EB92.1]
MLLEKCAVVAILLCFVLRRRSNLDRAPVHRATTDTTLKTQVWICRQRYPSPPSTAGLGAHMVNSRVAPMRQRKLQEGWPQSLLGSTLTGYAKLPSAYVLARVHYPLLCELRLLLLLRCHAM